MRRVAGLVSCLFGSSLGVWSNQGGAQTLVHNKYLASTTSKQAKEPQALLQTLHSLATGVSFPLTGDALNEFETAMDALSDLITGETGLISEEAAERQASVDAFPAFVTAIETVTSSYEDTPPAGQSSYETAVLAAENEGCDLAGDEGVDETACSTVATSGPAAKSDLQACLDDEDNQMPETSPTDSLAAATAYQTWVDTFKACVDSVATDLATVATDAGTCVSAKTTNEGGSTCDGLVATAKAASCVVYEQENTAFTSYESDYGTVSGLYDAQVTSIESASQARESVGMSYLKVLCTIAELKAAAAADTSFTTDCSQFTTEGTTFDIATPNTVLADTALVEGLAGATNAASLAEFGTFTFATKPDIAGKKATILDDEFADGDGC